MQFSITSAIPFLLHSVDDLAMTAVAEKCCSLCNSCTVFMCSRGMCIEPMGCELSCDTNHWHVHNYACEHVCWVDTGIRAIEIVNKAVARMSSRHHVLVILITPSAAEGGSDFGTNILPLFMCILLLQSLLYNSLYNIAGENVSIIIVNCAVGTRH